MSESDCEAEKSKPAPGIFVIGSFNGAFIVMANAFLDPETVLPAFAMRVMEGNVLWVGLIYAALQAGPFWPQVFLSRSMETVERLLPWYYLSLGARMAAILAAAVVVYFFAQSSPLIAFVLVAAFLFISFSSISLSLIPFIETVDAKVPAALHGRFFSLRYMAGGLAAFAGGFVVKWLLSPAGGLDFPANYAAVFACGAGAVLLALVVFVFVTEEKRKTANRRLSFRMHLARGVRMIRGNDNLRRLGKGRALNRAAFSLAFPFVVPYALKMLQMPEAAVGLLLSAKMLTYSLSNSLWTYISERWGNRAVMIASSAALLAVPVLTLTAAYLPDERITSVAGLGISAQLFTIIAVAILIGASLSGAAVGYNAFLMDILPDRKRSTFLGFYYLLILPTCVVPVAAAVIVGEDNFVYTMVLALVVGVISLIQVLRLRDFRAEEAVAKKNGAAK